MKNRLLLLLVVLLTVVGSVRAEEQATFLSFYCGETQMGDYDAEVEQPFEVRINNCLIHPISDLRISVVGDNGMIELNDADVDNPELVFKGLFDGIATVKLTGKSNPVRPYWENAKVERSYTVYVVMTVGSLDMWTTIGIVERLINNIGTVSNTAASVLYVRAVRAAYNRLGEAEQERLSNYELLTSAEEQQSSFMAAVTAFDKMVEELDGWSDTFERDVASARAAYNKLSTEQKKVAQYEKDLVMAEEYIPVKAVDELIREIRTDYDNVETWKAQIDAARTAYDKLTDSQKAIVRHYEQLEREESAYAESPARLVEMMIYQIDYYVINDETKAKAKAAREAYDALSAELKAKVDNYERLEMAENYIANGPAAEAVDALIESIRQGDDIEAWGAQIAAARAAYDKLTDAQKLLVKRYEWLTYEEERYWVYPADQVERMIMDLRYEDVNDEAKAKAKAARDAYEALSDELKAKVDNYERLERAENYIANFPAAKVVVDLIDAIGYPELTDACKAKIAAARAAYDKLTAAQKSFVNNYNRLEDSEYMYNIELPARAVMKMIDESWQGETIDEKKARAEAARAAYEELTAEQKKQVWNYSTLEFVESYVVDYPVAKAVMDMIDAIGDVEITDAFKAQIDAARKAYDKLTAAQKKYVNNYDKLDYVERQYAELLAEVNPAKAVDALIDAIGTVEYGRSDIKINEARRAYDKLTDAQKSHVEKYSTLTAAEARYAELKAAKEAAQAVDDLIDQIGRVEYTETCEGKIEAARGAYDNLTASQKTFVERYSTLTAAETEYAELKADNDAADAVDELIAQIGVVEYTETCKGKIEAARAAYDNLTMLQKRLVAGKEILTSAEAKYEILKADNDAADAVDALIAKIGTVEYTTTSKGKIEAARAAYDNLTTVQKNLVESYETLTAAETRYAELKTDNEAAVAVDALIAKVGTVEYTDASKGKIDAAREAYDKLTDAQKALVEKYSTLTTAETKYAELKADNEAADAVDALIAKIGTVKYNSTSKGKIDAARAAYDNLTAAQKTLVGKYSTLTAAETKYAELKADNDAAAAVDALIAKIGTVEYTTTSKGKIDAAREAYGKLTEAQKSLVKKYSTLTTAETKYAELKTDNEAAAAVDALIAKIGTVEYTTTCKGKIDAARAAYDKLTDAQKALVDSYATLTAAENKYAELKIDNDLADGVDVLIAQIGTVEYTSTSKSKIDAARTSYDNLTKAQKALVESYETLTAAEARYAALKADVEAAAAVDEVIAQIGTVEYTATSKSKIDAARTAYDKLSKAQKTLVGKYGTLTEAETKYAELKADVDAAAAVDALIAKIGTVEYTATSKGKIDAARAAYDKLTAAQKTIVSSLGTLTTAEAKYAELKADNEAAVAVDALIAEIGTVEYTSTSKVKIDAARAAYNKLTDEQKKIVATLSTLTDAESKYAALKADNDAAAAVDALIAKIGTVEFTSTSKGKIDAARAAYNGLTDAQTKLVKSLQTLVDAEVRYAELASDNDHVGMVEGLIAKIGAVEYTNACKANIDAARAAYDKLTAAQKSKVTSLGTLTAAESRYAELKADNDAAVAVDALIAEIGTVEYTATSKGKIDAARTAYDRLSTTQTALVKSLGTLTAAESRFAELKADNEAAAAVDALIAQIGEVEYTDASKSKIEAARKAYSNLSEARKTFVKGVATLSDAEVRYEALKADNEAAAAVDALIAKIGTVELTSTCKANIDAARAAYDKLTAAQKTIVSSLSMLTAAESKYAELKADVDAAQGVDELIAKIGAVELTSTCKANIDAARAAYNALTDVQTKLVKSLQTLIDAEVKYAELEAGNNKVAAVEGLIAKIGTVEYTNACKGLIDAARAAYDKLSKAQMAEVKNIETLTDAEARYAELKADNEAAQAVDDLIAEIGLVEYSETSKAKIDAARAAYDKLSKTQAALVLNIETLTDAEARYIVLKTMAEQMVADKQTFEEYKATVKKQIETLGSEDDSQTVKDLIATAVAAVEALAYDETTTLNGNKYAVDAIATKLQLDIATAKYAEVLEAMKATFEDYKTTLKGQADELGMDGDSQAVKDMIAAAKTAIDQTEYDEAKDIVGNMDAVAEIVKQLADDVSKQREAEQHMTAIENVVRETVDEWYDLGGRKLAEKPTRNGVYVRNCRLVRIK
ncbi:MAG: hypothetical protein II951_05950 [Bacteroidales bacterium]|nr:hypothetical protein [Bacteroidales bacterium]